MLVQKAGGGDAEKLSIRQEAYCDGKWRSCQGESRSAVSPVRSLKQSVAAPHCYGSLGEYWAELRKESGVLILLFSLAHRPTVINFTVINYSQ